MGLLSNIRIIESLLQPIPPPVGFLEKIYTNKIILSYFRNKHDASFMFSVREIEEKDHKFVRRNGIVLKRIEFVPTRS